MKRPENDITEAERSIFAAIGMTGMAGLSVFQGANVPEYRPMAYVFAGLWMGLAGVNAHTAVKISNRVQQDRLPFQDVPVLGTAELEKQIGLAG